MRYFGYTMTAIFVVFAILQYNDPDPYIWIPIYLVAAAFSALAANKIGNKLALIAGMVLYFTGSILLFPANNMDEWLHAEEKAKGLEMNMPFVEEARESMGLFICFATFTIYLFNATNSRKGRSRR